MKFGSRLNNAVKFSSTGGKVIVTAQKIGKEIVFSVQDFGVGMSEETQKR